MASHASSPVGKEKSSATIWNPPDSSKIASDRKRYPLAASTGAAKPDVSGLSTASNQMASKGDRPLSVVSPIQNVKTPATRRVSSDPPLRSPSVKRPNIQRLKSVLAEEGMYALMQAPISLLREHITQKEIALIEANSEKGEHPMVVRKKVTFRDRPLSNTVHDLTLFREPAMLEQQRKMEKKLNAGQSKEETVLIYGDAKANIYYGIVRLQYQPMSNETVMTLKDWIRPENAIHDPDDFLEENTKVSRDRIITIAHLLAKEVDRLHKAGVLMYGSLSPETVILSEIQNGDSVEYRVTIKDFSCTRIDPLFVAPWQKTIMDAAWAEIRRDECTVVQSFNNFNNINRWYQSDVQALAAMIWAMCEGGTEFMREPGWCYRVSFLDQVLTRRRVKWTSRWKLFYMIAACLPRHSVDDSELFRLDDFHPAVEVIRIVDYLEKEASKLYSHFVNDIGVVQRIEEAVLFLNGGMMPNQRLLSIKRQLVKREESIVKEKPKDVNV